MIRIQTENKPDEDQRKVEYEGPEPEFIEIPCLCHDNPFLVIPKDQRRPVLDALIKNDEFKWKLFTEKQYDGCSKMRSAPCVPPFTRAFLSA